MEEASCSASSVKSSGHDSKGGGYHEASKKNLKRKNASTPITNYFFKQPKNNDIQQKPSSNPQPEKPGICSQNEKYEISSGQGSSSCSVSLEAQVASSSESLFYFDNDIGNHINMVHKLSDLQKYEILKNPWMPPSDYIFPYCVVKKSGKSYKKHAQRSHFEKYNWLVLSHTEQGLYCKYCALFATDHGGGRYRASKLGSLVKTALKKFDDLLRETGALAKHEKSAYHLAACEAASDFVHIYKNRDKQIINQVSSHRMQQVKENIERLKPIVETIIFLGRNNIPLRGHRDSGPMSVNSESITANDGIFRAMLRFRIASGDKNLENHLKTSSSNATYISSITQNEIINCCREVVQNSIVEGIKKAPFFAIIFDETTDAAHIEQMSLSFRYLHDGNIREDFITFVDAYDNIRPEDIISYGSREERRLTGVALAHIVEDLLHSFSIDINKCVGVGTDSCSVMSSNAMGAVQEILKNAPNARRCPCANHMLNNSLAKTSKIQQCRNTTGTMKKIITFAKSSAKRFDVFKRELGGKSLEGLCETRWAEKHDGHLQFRENLPKIKNSLLIISAWKDTKTASDAFCLIQAISSPEFIVGTVSLCDVLCITAPLSRKLQSPKLDAKCAYDAVADTITVIENKRLGASTAFTALYKEMEKIAESLETELKAPRTASAQRNRSNHPSSNNEEYFLRSVYIPLLDNVLADLKTRFAPDVLNNYGLRVFLPTSGASLADVRDVAENYASIIGRSTQSVLNEYELWCAKWTREEGKGTALPVTLFEALDACDADMYPSIKLMLHILVTLPVSVATAERSFSSLRRLKTWMRSRMGEERLTGLALLYIHKDIEVTSEQVIERFANKKKRKIDFTI